MAKKKCTDPEAAKLLGAYLLEDNVLTKRQLAKFEKHVLECEACWAKIKRHQQREDRTPKDKDQP
ncbi:MAG: zf-HC2 domain-containing protein [Candidatus Doudnabacteria bacterium]